MKRPKLRKASKRMSCSKRYKIQRKVKEHKRKVRKEAKKKGLSRRPKKDISIPNDAPFKEDILREAEQRKQQREELKKQRKLDRQKEVEKKRKLKEKKETPVKKNKEVKEKKTAVTKPKKVPAKNSAASFCREVNKVIEAADVILEVLDARDPMGSRCVQAEQAVLQSPNKKLILVLNKIDLVPKDNVEKWLQFLSRELPTIVFKCSTQVHEKIVPGYGRKINPNCIDISKGTMSYGADSLLKVFNSLCSGQTGAIKVGLIGFSNAGKSSLINTLKEYRACNVGALRGTTRVMQDVKLDDKIKILDSPSLVVSPDNRPEALIMRSAFVKDDDNPTGSVIKIIKLCNKQQVMLHYNVPDFRSPMEFLNLLANKRGLLKKKGLPDLEAAAKLFLNDWMGARLFYYTQPPASFSSHIDCSQISAMQKAVNCTIIEEENKRTLKSIRNPSYASSITFHYSHITNGILNENELQDKEPTDPDNEEEEEIEEEEKETGDDEENEMPEVGEKTAPTEKNVKSVSFDKPAEAANDDYDFNADFN